jgi:hypothetical protein
MVERAEAQLEALDQLQALTETKKTDDDLPSLFGTPVLSFPPPPLKTAILRVLKEDPETRWHRDELFAEVMRRGWGPGGSNPRNTFTSRLRDLEKDGRVKRYGRDVFASKQNEEAAAM